VHERLYDKFVAGWVDLTRKYVLGSRSIRRPRSAQSFARGGRRDPSPDRANVAAGARAVIDEKEFATSRPARPTGPQVLIGVDHSMP